MLEELGGPIRAPRPFWADYCTYMPWWASQSELGACAMSSRWGTYQSWGPDAEKKAMRLLIGKLDYNQLWEFTRHQYFSIGVKRTSQSAPLVWRVGLVNGEHGYKGHPHYLVSMGLPPSSTYRRDYREGWAPACIYVGRSGEYMPFGDMLLGHKLGIEAGHQLYLSYESSYSI